MARKRLDKTWLMQLVENRNNGQPIEQLMVERFHKHGSERRAAHSLGITQQAFNAWKYRLGLEEQIVYSGASNPGSKNDTP